MRVRVLWGVVWLGLALVGCDQAPAAAPPDSRAADEIVVGVAVSLTGTFAPEGLEVRRGYELWAAHANARGGLAVGARRQPVKLVIRDDESDAATAARLVERLIVHDKARFLLGPYGSVQTKAAALVAEQFDTVMVQGNGSAENLFERRFKNVFAVLTSAGHYAESTLTALAARGARTIAVAYEDSSGHADVARGAERCAPALGMRIVAVEAYPRGVADVRDLVARMQSLDPDVLVACGYFNESLLFVRAARGLGFSPRAMVLTVGPSNPDFLAQLGADAEGLIGPAQWHRAMAHRDSVFGSAQDYHDRFSASFGCAPSYQAAAATAAGLALELAIGHAGSVEISAVRQALRTLEAETFFGPIGFDEAGRNIKKSMGTTQVRAGELVLVDGGGSALTYPKPPWTTR